MGHLRIFMLLVAFIFLILLSVKYRTFKSFTSGSSLRLVLLDLKLASFYGQHLRFPRSKAEYSRYLLQVGDDQYTRALDFYNYKVHCDSTHGSILLYANGMDWDDDGATPSYYIQSKNFLESLLIDGDVILQKAEVPYICNHFPGNQLSSEMMMESKS